MKKCVKIISALLLVVVLCSSASAALPSLTVIMTKTDPACKQMAAVVQELMTAYRGKFDTEPVYIDDNPGAGRAYNVRYVPTLIYRDANKKIVAQEAGYRSTQDILKTFAKAGIR